MRMNRRESDGGHDGHVYRMIVKEIEGDGDGESKASLALCIH